MPFASGYGPQMSSPDPAGLHDLALQLMGSFTGVQWAISELCELHLASRAPAVAALLTPDYLSRLTDKERVAWLKAIVNDCQISSAPIAQMETLINESKRLRDFIAHSPGVGAIYYKGQPRLAVSHYASKRRDANVLGEITDTLLRSYIARLAWVQAWLFWIISETGYREVYALQGDELRKLTRPITRPSPHPPALRS